MYNRYCFQLGDDILCENSEAKIPMKKLPNDCVGTFKYSSPSRIVVGGSYSLDTIIGPNAVIDILVEMPKNLFSAIDCKNYRYMRKKAIYLAYIGNSINQELAEKTCFIGNHSSPMLKVVPNGSLGKRFIIYVHVLVEENTFKLNKFTPEKNNVKSKWFFNKSNVKDGKYF